MNHEQTERLMEIQRRLEIFGPQDRTVLGAISAKHNNGIDPIHIAVDKFILPCRVDESLSKLEELGFVGWAEIEGENRLVINANGADAQVVAKLFRD